MTTEPTAEAPIFLTTEMLLDAIRERLTDGGRFTDQLIELVIGHLAAETHMTAVDRGFYDNPRSTPESILLVITELAELTEALRDPQMLDSEKIPLFTLAEEEIADVVIRSLDLAAFNHWRVGPAIVAKMRYNTGRPIRHGKQF